MRLSDLINGERPPFPADVDISGLSADSRQVRPGYLFAALSGTRADGAEFIDDAIAHGAVAILGSREIARGEGRVPVIADDNPRRRLALMAARFYGEQPRVIAAVTGTNGKTSVADFVRQIWLRLGYRAASMGTLGVIAPGIREDVGHTTPDPVALHRVLAGLARAGIDHLALEASSHGLDQCRLDGVRVGVAAFTNLSRDHLDYHADADSYLQAKLRLFETVMAPGGTAVINADADIFTPAAEVARRCGHRVLGYGSAGDDIRLLSRDIDGDGQVLALRVSGHEFEVRLPLAGAFQASNALCALGIVVALADAALADAVAALGHLEGVPGRLELVARHPCGAPVYVDYAHTPDALETVLDALRPHAGNRLLVVFGCGGDRDRGKRPAMGRIAATRADRVFLTDDNPRGEAPAAIRAEILSACPGAAEIGDRAEAIAAAVSELRPGDVLVVAGKGHEQGQIVGDTVRPFDDAAVVRAAVARVAEVRP